MASRGHLAQLMSTMKQHYRYPKHCQPHGRKHDAHGSFSAWEESIASSEIDEKYKLLLITVKRMNSIGTSHTIEEVLALLKWFA